MPKTITLYHGTTYDSFLKIKKELFQPKDPIWNCSIETDVYFYPQLTEDNAFELAISNGQIAAALTRQNSNTLGLIKLIVPASLYKTIFKADVSCDNMDDIAVSVNHNVLNNYIKQGKIKAIFIEAINSYKPIYRDIYLINVCTNPYLDIVDTEEINYLNTLSHCLMSDPDYYYDLYDNSRSNDNIIKRKEVYEV